MTKTLIHPDLAYLIDRWEPSDHPVHCANCLYAKVSGSADLPLVACAKGHGKARTCWQLWRASSPFGFQSAKTCPDFTSMDDDA